MKKTCRQMMKLAPSNAPAITGPLTLPRLEPNPCMEMANPRRSGKRWEMAAEDGRCHRDPGMDSRNTTVTRRAKVGAAPIAAKVMAWPSIQAVRMMPQ